MRDDPCPGCGADADYCRSEVARGCKPCCDQCPHVQPRFVYVMSEDADPENYGLGEQRIALDVDTLAELLLRASDAVLYSARTYDEAFPETPVPGGRERSGSLTGAIDAFRPAAEAIMAELVDWLDEEGQS